MSSFPPIADYGFIRTAEQLSDRGGRFHRMDVSPRPNAPSIFGALVDRTPECSDSDRRRRTSRTSEGTARDDGHRDRPGTRPPDGCSCKTSFPWTGTRGGRGPQSGEHHRANVRGNGQPCPRRATCIGGEVEVVVNCVPLLDYGTTMVTWDYDEAEYQSMSADSDGDALRSRLTSFDHARHGGSTLLRAHHLEAGDPVSCLSWSDTGPNRPGRSGRRTGVHRGLLADRARVDDTFPGTT